MPEIRFRTTWLVVLTSVLLASSPAHAEETGPEEDGDDAPFGWTVQVDPLTTLLGFVHLQVERRFTRHASIYVGPHLRLFSAPFAEQERFTGLGAEIGVRWYFRGTAPRGWWLLARGVLAGLHAEIDGVDETGGGGYGSLLAGYTFLLSDWFVLSFGGGVQYIDYTIGDMGPKGVFPAAHTALGIAF